MNEQQEWIITLRCNSCGFHYSPRLDTCPQCSAPAIPLSGDLVRRTCDQCGVTVWWQGDTSRGVWCDDCIRALLAEYDAGCHL